jgi:hypothetical protein
MEDIVFPDEGLQFNAAFAVSPLQNSVAVGIGGDQHYEAGAPITLVNGTNTATIDVGTHAILPGDYIWLTEIDSTQAVKDKPQLVSAVGVTTVSFIDANIVSDESTYCSVLLSTDQFSIASAIVQGDPSTSLYHAPVFIQDTQAHASNVKLRCFFLAAQKFNNALPAYINYLDQAYQTSYLEIEHDITANFIYR